MSAKDHTFTLGIEEEFAIVDPDSRELRSHIHEILEDGKVTLKEQIKPEMHQSVVELGTEICRDIDDARMHVTELRSRLAALAARSKLKVASVGTHPFSHWRDQLITQGERYREIVKDMQQLARESHFRTARSCWHSRSRVGHPRDESGAIFSAAHLRALGQLAILGWPGHGLERLSTQSVRAFSAHRDSRCLREPFRVRRLLQAAGQDRLC